MEKFTAFLKRAVKAVVILFVLPFSKLSFFPYKVIRALDDMQPYFKENELVIVKTNAENYFQGDIIAFIHPFSDYVLVQKVANMFKDDEGVVHYNTCSSRGSFNFFGEIRNEHIIGRVIM